MQSMEFQGCEKNDAFYTVLTQKTLYQRLQKVSVTYLLPNHVSAGRQLFLALPQPVAFTRPRFCSLEFILELQVQGGTKSGLERLNSRLIAKIRYRYRNLRHLFAACAVLL